MAELNFHQLRIFATVAQFHSFSRAARELNITQPAVSSQVRQFEEDLGISLIDRVGRRVSLTDAGRTVSDFAQQMFAIAEDMLQSVESLRDMSRGHLALGANRTIGEYLLPPLLGRYRRAHPGVDLQLEIGSAPTILDSVARHRLDIGFVANDVRWRDVVASPFGQDELVLVGPPGHPLAAAAQVEAADLDGADWVMREPTSATRRLVERRLSDLGIEARPVLELTSNEAVKQAVIANLGLAVLSRCVVAMELEVGRLVTLPASGLECQRSMSFVVHRDKQLSGPERAFLDLIPG